MLRDGVILCNILNKILPGCIPEREITKQEASFHFRLKNVAMARQALIEKFHFREKNIFAPRDLVSLDDFYRVLVVFSELSKSSEALTLGATPWPPDEYHMSNDEGVYGCLDELSPLAGRQNRFSNRHGSNASATLNNVASNRPLSATAEALEEGEEIYQNLVNRVNDSSGSGELIYHVVCAAQPSTPTPERTQREYAIDELLQTEESFVTSLKAIVQEIMQPSRTIIVDGNTWLQLFQYFEDIYQLHDAFLDELRIQVDNVLRGPGKNSLNLLGIWQRRKRGFLIYAKYICNHPKAEAAYDRIDKGDPVVRKKFMDLCSSVQKIRSFSLREYLFVPIQRLLKYHLLLQAIHKKSTDPDEKRNLAQSLEIVKDIQLAVDKASGDRDLLDHIQTLQSSITDMHLPDDTKLSDYGRLLIDGEILIRSHADTSARIRSVFLFDTMLIICKILPQKNQQQQYKFRDCCYVINVDVFERDVSSIFKPKDKFKYMFEVRKKTGPAPDDSIENVFLMAVKSESERNNWVREISNAKEKLRPKLYDNKGHLFVYTTFKEIYECSVCNKFLCGGLFQGYECSHEHCRIICHGKCMANVAPQVEKKPLPVVAVRSYDGASPPHPRSLPTLPFQLHDVFSMWCPSSNNWAYGERGEYRGFFPMSHVAERSRQVSTPPNQIGLFAFPWFVGEMAKEDAARMLKGTRSGSFLVRKSMANSQRPGELAISLKYDPDETVHIHDTELHVRHIRIVRLGDRFSLSHEPPFFQKLPDLISYYQQSSLQSVFNELPLTLQFPLGNANSVTYLFRATAIADFNPSATNELSFGRGEEIEVLSTTVSQRPNGDWWLGRNRYFQIGIFPADYVRKN